MKEPKKDNQYYYDNQNLNNKSNPFIKELNKVNNNEIDTIEKIESERSEEIEKQPESQVQIKKLDYKLEKINLIGDKTKKTNDYTSFNEKEKEKEKEKEINNINAELIELKEKYEKTVNEILIEEKNCLENHKSHIDNMVLTMKTEMNLINTLEQKSNVDEYVDKILDIFGEQENKINQMKQKLLGFKK